MRWKNLPFYLLHVSVLGVFFVPFTWKLALLTVLVHQFFCFAFTTGYHRGLCHRSYEASRCVRFALAWIASSGVYVGVLRWVAVHRAHHRHADTEWDPHSPRHRGFVGAYFAGDPEYVEVRWEYVEDLSPFSELRWLERWSWLPGALWIVILGWAFGPAVALYGGVLPAVALMHSVSLLNVYAHGRDPAAAAPGLDVPWLAWLLQGEGWHRQHHEHPRLASFSPRGRSYDPAYWGLSLLRRIGLVRENR